MINNDEGKIGISAGTGLDAIQADIIAIMVE